MFGKNLLPISSLFAEIQNVKVLKNLISFIVGYLVAIETRVTLFRSMHFLRRTVMAQAVVFMFLVTLTLTFDLCSIHALGRV